MPTDPKLRNVCTKFLWARVPVRQNEGRLGLKTRLGRLIEDILDCSWRARASDGGIGIWSLPPLEVDGTAGEFPSSTSFFMHNLRKTSSNELRLCLERRFSGESSVKRRPERIIPIYKRKEF